VNLQVWLNLVVSSISEMYVRPGSEARSHGCC